MSWTETSRAGPLRSTVSASKGLSKAISPVAPTPTTARTATVTREMSQSTTRTTVPFNGLVGGRVPRKDATQLRERDEWFPATAMHAEAPSDAGCAINVEYSGRLRRAALCPSAPEQPRDRPQVGVRRVGAGVAQLLGRTAGGHADDVTDARRRRPPGPRPRCPRPPACRRGRRPAARRRAGSRPGRACRRRRRRRSPRRRPGRAGRGRRRPRGTPRRARPRSRSPPGPRSGPRPGPGRPRRRPRPAARPSGTWALTARAISSGSWPCHGPARVGSTSSARRPVNSDRSGSGQSREAK